MDKKSSLGAKMIALMAFGCTLLLLGVAAFSVIMYNRERQAALDDLVKTVQTLQSNIEQVEEAARNSAQQSFSILKSQFNEGGFEWEDKSGSTEATLRYEGKDLHKTFDQVDRFSVISKGVATVFVRTGEDFKRISTSLKKEDGSRAIDTLLDRNHPAYKLLLDKKTYVGRAVLFGKTYMTQYEPVIKDDKVIAVLFVGHDMGAQLELLKRSFVGFNEENLKTMAIDVRAGANKGGIFGSDVAKLDSGSALMQRLEAKLGSGEKEGLEQDVSVAPWLKDDDDTNSAWSYFEPWGWVVVSTQTDADMMYHSRNDIIMLWVIVMVGAIVAAVVVFIGIGKMVMRPLKSAVGSIALLEKGDYSQPIVPASDDEIGVLMRGVERVRQELARNVRELSQNASQVDGVALQVTQGAEKLEHRTNRTKEQVQVMHESVEQLVQALQKGSTQIAQTVSAVEGSVKASGKSDQMIEQLVQGMDQMAKGSEKIGQIIGTIDAIAFQTNILALNAAVEAARAGESGRGFAVVASEVRALAGRSAQASKEIKELIQTNVAQVQSATQEVDSVRSVIKDLTNEVQKVSATLELLTGVSKEQQQVLSVVSDSTTEIASVSNQNDQMVQELSTLCAALTQQTQLMESTLRKYQT